MPQDFEIYFLRVSNARTGGRDAKCLGYQTYYPHARATCCAGPWG